MFFKTFFDSFEFTLPEVISIFFFPLYDLAHYIQTILTLQKQPPEVFYNEAILKIFAIFTGKYLSWSLFLIKLQASKKRLQHRCFLVSIANFWRTYFEENLRTTASEFRKRPSKQGWKTFTLCIAVIVAQRCSAKRLFPRTSQNAYLNTCDTVFLIMVVTKHLWATAM